MGNRAFFKIKNYSTLSIYLKTKNTNLKKIYAPMPTTKLIIIAKTFEHSVSKKQIFDKECKCIYMYIYVSHSPYQKYTTKATINQNT